MASVVAMETNYVLIVRLGKSVFRLYLEKCQASSVCTGWEPKLCRVLTSIPGFDFENLRARTLTLAWRQKHLQITLSALGIDSLFEVHYVLFSQIKELLAPFLLSKVGQQQLFSSERLMQLLFQQRCPYEGTLPCKLQYT